MQISPMKGAGSSEEPGIRYGEHNFYRLIAATVRDRFGDRSEISILEPGCGHGAFMKAIVPLLEADFPSVKFNVHGFDVRETPSHHALDGDAVRLISEQDEWPYGDGEFQIVHSNQVLEHVKDLGFFLRQNSRVLEPNGCALHFFPTKEIIKEPHYLLPFVHWIDNWDLRKRVIEALSSLGLGTYRRQVQEGFSGGLQKWSRMSSDYTTNFTHYRRASDYLTEAKPFGLRASFRFNHEIHLMNLRSKFRLSGTKRIETNRKYSFILDGLLFYLIHKRRQSVMLFLEKRNEMIDDMADRQV